MLGRRLRASSAVADAVHGSQLNVAGAVAENSGFLSLLSELERDRFVIGGGSVLSQYSVQASSLPVSSRFVAALASLPSWPATASSPTQIAETTDAYERFFDRFGTHYVSGVSVGGAVEVTATVSQCAASIGAVLSQEDLNNSVAAAMPTTIGGDYPGAFAGLAAERRVVGGDSNSLIVPAVTAGELSDAVSAAIGDWSSSVAGSPGVIGLELAPITALAEVAGASEDEIADLTTAFDQYVAAAARTHGGDERIEAGIDTSSSSQCTSRAETSACTDEEIAAAIAAGQSNVAVRLSRTSAWLTALSTVLALAICRDLSFWM
eukprot:Plantae.Rhodophyta-Rhodochaete_pulchella.ctg35014.p1 GENE.Plantae.Rhodophyta-Rhodochaete_pulchella.ctg35014~~Plantae.Rhodophyta-Rhodochaete_pulchella.ctg35014.p1  ORF type:complete len:357 (+),score=43.48 Plantae.Rhodophyta-Rhodochaete_pulchella.ctg35014:110-1072(+)